MENASNHRDRHALIGQLRRKGMSQSMRGYLDDLPVGGLEAQAMKQQPHHTVQGGLCHSASSPLQQKSIGGHLVSFNRYLRDFGISTLVDLKAEQKEQQVLRVIINIILSALGSSALWEQAQDPAGGPFGADVFELFDTIGVLGYLLYFAEPCSGYGSHAYH